jgi:hypothetical protein
MKKFYIGERINPQLKKSYYICYGRLTKKDAIKKENCVYGSMILTSYENENLYNEAIKILKDKGFRIS